jgi:hypothetical protein
MKTALIVSTLALALAGCASKPSGNASASSCATPARAADSYSDADALARRTASFTCGGGGSPWAQARDREAANRRNTPYAQLRTDNRLAMFGQGKP